MLTILNLGIEQPARLQQDHFHSLQTSRYGRYSAIAFFSLCRFVGEIFKL